MEPNIGEAIKTFKALPCFDEYCLIDCHERKAHLFETKEHALRWMVERVFCFYAMRDTTFFESEYHNWFTHTQGEYCVAWFEKGRDEDRNKPAGNRVIKAYKFLIAKELIEASAISHGINVVDEVVRQLILNKLPCVEVELK